MLDVLDRWVERGWLRSLDAGFARFLSNEVPHAPPLLLLAAALASHQLGRGHVCLDLQATIDDPTFVLSLPPEEPNAWARPDAAEPRALPPTPSEVLAGTTLDHWLQALDERTTVADGAGSTPLVLIDARLYLRRYWQYEQDVRAGIERRLAASTKLQSALPMDAVRRALDVLFPAAANTGARTDWQKLACALAARSGFSIVTGGPGTGKTTTVVKLLALLQALALHAPRISSDASSMNTARPLRIRLAAPTGKAAARLNESIAGAVARLPVDALPDGEAVRAAIPNVVTTLHRVLGTLPDTRRFRHDAGNPLPVDVLVIDEASMVDLEMMAAVLAALPPSARLILLGDKDQLASVEAGAVIGELCARAAGGHYTSQTAAWLEAATGERIDAAMIDADGTPLDQAIAMLRHSHRFASDSGIGLLASFVNAGDADAVDRIWADAHADLALVRCPAGDDAAFRSLVIDGGASHGDGRAERQGYRHYLDVMHAQRPLDDDVDAWALAVLEAHDAFQLLCALRRGPWGVEGLNRRVARLLQDEKLIDARGEWFAGRPVLVTRNDYELGLMNGDIGIALELPGGALRVAFPAADGSGGVKWVLPSRLQAVETVFALTVHKSQGSEFVHAALVLPESFSPVMTRELVYTGITRAKKWLSLAVMDGSDTLRLAVDAKVRRASGLGVV
ncbi:exodeoxyribonuclease V subunit alpha [Paraburkholderia phosphatilytica]|uniref:exodeoxyribonuclease V subunit alpha n=1 Tax=Paraburkholderia phosphatilytica TaxID=2282883 RepID=UPI00197FF05E|nr:exodeoxyribonuclease V subunit alpha [Paraburkholderia phosphatilytica]